MDRRTKYTKKIIKDTLIDLLEEKNISKITVSEICQIADINRATFYRYYLDVYDLLNSIEKEIEIELTNSYKPTSDKDISIENFTRTLLTVLLKNRKLIKILFETNENVFFLYNILEFAYINCREKWIKDLPSLSDEDIEYAALFIFNGALGIVNYWVKEDFNKDIDEITSIIVNLSYYGIRNFIYKIKN